MGKITEKDIQEILDLCYKRAIDGIVGSKSVKELAEDYLSHGGT